MRRTIPVLAFVLALAAVPSGPAIAQEKPAPPGLSVEARVDAVFARWNRSDTPGCVVGVASRGEAILLRAYGMSNLEYGLRIRPDTIFESGSVAKQFTAAAIALLVQDGRLSLDDPVRKYVPELPDFGAPVLIRHLLNHTSGLRSQWPLLTLSGRPPGEAVHTVDEILELVGRMKELNFKPGDEFLYNNTGYTLLGVVVARVSGKSLADFSRERLFQPLGMSRTQWREDFRKIVPDRATAYRQDKAGVFFAAMPFTDVIGNGGLLTTAGDLLIWNENLDNPRVGGLALVDQLQTKGRLNDGTENEYAQGLILTTYKGLREISHGGSTAGYQTFLARYPEEHLSIVVLSNVTTSGPARLAHEVADIFLSGKVTEPVQPVPAEVPAEVLKAWAGIYREPLTDAALRVEIDKDGKTLRLGGQLTIPVSPTVFVTADGARTAAFQPGEGRRPLRIRDSDGRTKPRIWEAVPPFAPKPEALAAYTGRFTNEEIDTTYTLSVEGGKLRVRFHPAVRLDFEPVYPDAFELEGNVLRFTRDRSGRVDGFLVYAGRVRHLRFVKRG